MATPATLLREHDGFAPVTLQGPAYSDPEVLAREQRVIFARSWIYACHEEKLRAPGDYVVTEVAGESLILLRGEAGELKAFFNVCAHRASPLLAGEGRVQRITCPYHAWSYDGDGRLVAAPNARNVPGFERAAYRLKPAGVEALHGLVFVNLDPDAAPLAEQAAGLDAELRAYAPDLPALTFVQRTEATLKANWKVAVENYSECYHCALVHRDFVSGVVDPRSYRVQVRGLWHKHLSRARKGSEKAYAFDAGAAPHADEFGAWWLWPSFAFQSYPGGAVHVWKWTPIAVDETHVAVDWFFPSAELEDWQRDLVRQHAATTFVEDIPLVEGVQRGLSSRAFEAGPLMIDARGSELSEHGVAAIQDLWRAAMRTID